MEPQNTQNTQMDTGEARVSLLSKRIIGCALTVLVEHMVLVELKAAKTIDEIHRAQCLII
jgi:hypothetical protein